VWLQTGIGLRWIEPLEWFMLVDPFAVLDISGFR
jgi:hypothetical protein